LIREVIDDDMPLHRDRNGDDDIDDDNGDDKDEGLKPGLPESNGTGAGMSDTYVSATSLQAALCAAGTACRAVDVVMCGKNTNAFACTRPPGHHAGRYGCTSGCLSTGFCLLNNAAIATVYSRYQMEISIFPLVIIVDAK
jgi:acetoin utilization deacetylase AcuC-like enzyme